MSQMNVSEELAQKVRQLELEKDALGAEARAMKEVRPSCFCVYRGD